MSANAKKYPQKETPECAKMNPNASPMSQTISVEANQVLEQQEVIPSVSLMEDDASIPYTSALPKKRLQSEEEGPRLSQNQEVAPPPETIPVHTIEEESIEQESPASQTEEEFHVGSSVLQGGAGAREVRKTLGLGTKLPEGLISSSIETIPNIKQRPTEHLVNVEKMLSSQTLRSIDLEQLELSTGEFGASSENTESEDTEAEPTQSTQESTKLEAQATSETPAVFFGIALPTNEEIEAELHANEPEMKVGQEPLQEQAMSETTSEHFRPMIALPQAKRAKKPTNSSETILSQSSLTLLENLAGDLDLPPTPEVFSPEMLTESVPPPTPIPQSLAANQLCGGTKTIPSPPLNHGWSHTLRHEKEKVETEERKEEVYAYENTERELVAPTLIEPFKPFESEATNSLPFVRWVAGEMKTEFLSGPRYRWKQRLKSRHHGDFVEVDLVEDQVLRRQVERWRWKESAKDHPQRLCFLEEIRTLGSLHHEGIPTLFEAGSDDKQRCFAIVEHIPGQSWQAILKGLRAGYDTFHERYPLRLRLQMGLQLLTILRFAHQNGILLLNLDAKHLLAGERERVCILDWRIARKSIYASMVHEQSQPDLGRTMEPFFLPDTLHHETPLGFVVGEPRYMAPEQAQCLLDSIDEKTDIYGVCVLLYEWLTLRHPFAEEVEEAAVFQQALQPQVLPAHEVRHPTQKSISKGLSKILMRGLEINPQMRYHSIDELLDTFRNVLR